MGLSHTSKSERGFTLLELLVVFLVLAILAGFAIPAWLQISRSLRISGDARSLAGVVSLAKMRSAADFTHARVYFDLSAGTYRLEEAVKSSNGSSVASWATNGGTLQLSQGVQPGFGTAGVPPPSTQTLIGQAPACLDSASNSAPVGSTACIVFNSRGVPVDSAGNPTSAGAFYITNGRQIFGVTVNAMGRAQTWTYDLGQNTWARQ